MTNFKEIFPGLDFLHDAHPETATEISSLVPMIAEHAWGELREGGRQQIQPVLHNNDELYDPSAERAFELLRGVAECYIAGGGGIRMGINRYLPGGVGEWHDDYPPFLPVYVLGLTDIEEPSFEHAGTAPELDDRYHVARLDSDAGEIVIKRGDLLRVSGYGLQHRGINPTEEMRYTGIFFDPYSD